MSQQQVTTSQINENCLLHFGFILQIIAVRISKQER